MEGPTRATMATTAYKRPRAVYFTHVEIVELPYTIGDNPSVSGGVPISASWISQKRTSLDLEFFEQYRPPRRDKRALHLTKEARLELMLQNGHTQSEIQFASEEAAKTRQQRLETIQEIRQKVKAFLSSGKAHPNPSTGRAPPSPMPPAVRSQHLPPSPIIPRRSPVRVAQYDSEKFPHLQFPQGQGNSVLSPRCQRRKRPAPIDLGGDLLHGGDALTSHIYNSTPKRLRSPCNKGNEQPALSPRRGSTFSSSMRFPARVKSPTVDSRPLMLPRRLASPPPPPSMLFQRSPQHPRTM